VPVRRRPLSMRDMTYAAQAEHTASQLLVFYHSIAQLASALEVPRAKARGWSAGTAPARPPCGAAGGRHRHSPQDGNCRSKPEEPSQTLGVGIGALIVERVHARLASGV
jgi:hypothetical protein